jgi:hypothetical protein
MGVPFGPNEVAQRLTRSPLSICELAHSPRQIWPGKPSLLVNQKPPYWLMCSRACGTGPESSGAERACPRRAVTIAE